MVQTETVLLKRFTGSGDAEAFAEIIRRHAGLVYGAALRILADVDRASDVAQETFLQLTKDAGQVTGSLPGWLHRVATHKAIDQMRRDASRKHREREYATRQPDEPSEWKKISPYVDVGLRELDPEVREVLILHFLEGRTTLEIAALQGASQATISRRIGSGVEQLRAKLRRRGVIVAIGALSALLGDNAVQAAPLAVLTELGKMAIVVGVAAGTASAGSGLHAIATSILTAVQTKAVAVAAVAVIGTGSVVTYYEMTRSSAPEPVVSAPAPPMATNPLRVPAGSPLEAEKGPALANNWPQAETQWDPPTATNSTPMGAAGGEALISQGPAMDATDGVMEPTPGEKLGGMMGGLGGMGGSVGAQNDLQEQPAGQMGGFYYSDRAGDRSGARPAEDANDRDPNDPGKP